MAVSVFFLTLLGGLGGDVIDSELENLVFLEIHARVISTQERTGVVEDTMGAHWINLPDLVVGSLALARSPNSIL